MAQCSELAALGRCFEEVGYFGVFICDAQVEYSGGELGWLDRFAGSVVILTIYVPFQRLVRTSVRDEVVRC